MDELCGGHVAATSDGMSRLTTLSQLLSHGPTPSAVSAIMWYIMGNMLACHSHVRLSHYSLD